ncbi:MAG: hypothetical protein K0U93_07525 [Gammaproteobacteria bacterium]|nr:hypothetical protein [Gammaproteobacteria bacterium]
MRGNSKGWKKSVRRLSTVGLMCAVGFCGFAVSAAEPKKGGTLTVGLETDVRGFDTVKGGVYGISGRTVAGAIQEPLLMATESRDFAPHLAVSWEANEAGTEWVIKLREGVKFHDGKPFNADAVAKHFNRILDPANKSRSRAFITAVIGAEAVDELTVKFTLQHPWHGFLPMLSDRDMTGLIESPDTTAAGTQNRAPVGTGPFVFKEWRGGDRIIVERNPDYWDKDKIHLDKIVYRILPDPQTRFQSLLAGDVDVIWTDRGNSINQAKKNKDVVVHEQEGAGSGLFLLNASTQPLDDERVRQAVQHALSTPVVIKVLWKDTRPDVKHPLPHQCDNHGFPEYDVKKAKALVESIGTPIKLNMIHTTTPRGRELGEIYQQMLKKAGIELVLEPVDQNTLVKRVFTNKYQMSGWRVADAMDVGAQLFGLSHSKSPYNITRNKNDELDKIALAMRTAPTAEKRKALQCDLVRYINKTGNMRFGPGSRYHVITRPGINGMRAFTMGSAYVWYMWKG